MRRLSRRTFLGGLGAAAALGISGCGTGADEYVTPQVSRGTPLRVLNWADYVDVDLLDQVMASISNAPTYSTEWEGNFLVDDLFGPQWDIVMPTNWLAAQLIEQADVRQLPLELIPNHVNIDPVFLTNDWDRGARFHMPWQAGITGIAYDPALTGRELTSVLDLFADDLGGRVSMIGEMREAVGLAMLANGDDPARPTPDTAEAGFERLQRSDASGQFVSWGFEDFAEQLAKGEVAAAMAWSGDVVQLQVERPDIRFVVPEDGAIQWFDTMVMPAGSNNPGGAAEFMNAFYDPVIAATNTEYVQYISPVLGVREELQAKGGEAAALAENTILFPDDETRRRLFIWGGFDDADAENDLDARFATFAGVA